MEGRVQPELGRPTEEPDELLGDGLGRMVGAVLGRTEGGEGRMLGAELREGLGAGLGAGRGAGLLPREPWLEEGRELWAGLDPREGLDELEPREPRWGAP